MLELLYIGRFDYLARPGIHAPVRVPNDSDVEAALRELKASENKREAATYSDIDERKTRVRA